MKPKMKLGTVIDKDGELYVVTELTNGQVSKTEMLDRYMARNLVVNYAGESRTMHEIIQIYCDEHLATHDVVKEPNS